MSQCARGAERVVRRDIGQELPAWCSVVNPGVEEAYFRLWQDLNMLYERLSLPWRLLQCPKVRKPIRAVVDSLYDDINTLWYIQRGNIRNCDELPLGEQVETYAEGGLRATPWSAYPVDAPRLRLVGYPGRGDGGTISLNSRGRNAQGSCIDSTAPRESCQS